MRRLALVAGVWLTTGCGGEGGPMGEADAGAAVTTYCCSINSRAYDCPDQAAVEQCANLNGPDPSRCSRRASPCG